MSELATRNRRLNLPAREAYYSQVLGEGRALCYRKRRVGHAGRWFLRTSKPDGGYSHEVLGAADDIAEADGSLILTYEQALKDALSKNNADPKKKTIQQALDEWAANKTLEATSKRQRKNFAACARRIGRPFVARTLKTITAKDILEWRNSFVENAEDPQPRRSSANRELATLKAALNLAAKTHSFQGVRPWDSVSKFKKSESHGARQLILTETQENQIIHMASPDLRDLLKALQGTGCRVGEIRSAKVRSLHANLLTVNGKTGARTIPLSNAKANWFKIRTEGKSSNAPLISRADGSAWPENGYVDEFKAIVKSIGLPDETVVYTFRHGFITRALERGVPTAAVAEYCGTSVRMIEETYAHFAKGTLSHWFE